ncbi:MAG: bifunctional folylpolyglutamate synthase/dihydrofolate synthase [Clostridiales bacterium]|nr:bifunctional folylpolyglutamate synthase/dihydrofolate synthase [Clostridiales bacterium]
MTSLEYFKIQKHKMGQAAEYISDIPLWSKDKHSLDQIRAILRHMGDPQESLRVIHVAGTNGKGSVCADLTAMLMEAGYQVGTFVSPHLTDLRERFLLDGKWIPENELEESVSRVRTVVETMKPEEILHPTFFEFVFLVAMDYYHRLQPDFVILETGLGGRLDATNVVKRPLACVITSISFDHMQYLGHTIREIAGEKAGIIKQDVPVIYDANDADATQVIADAAERAGADAYPVREAESYRGTAFAAPYQAMNAALAVQTLRILQVEGVDEAVMQRGLGKVCWPGRMQEVLPDVWVDGAHNPGGIEAFIRAVRSQDSKKAIHLLFAAVSDKDDTTMIRELTEELAPVRVTVAHLDSERSQDESILADHFREAGCPLVEQYRTTGEALQAALAHKTEKDRLYIVGSLYLIGEILKEIPAAGQSDR